MNKHAILSVVNGAVHPTAAPFIPAVRRLVESANEVACVLGEPSPAVNLGNIYKARRDRLAKAGQAIPAGMNEAIEVFAQFAERTLSTCYIKADDRFVYFWRDESATIVALVLT